MSGMIKIFRRIMICPLFVMIFIGAVSCQSAEESAISNDISEIDFFATATLEPAKSIYTYEIQARISESIPEYTFIATGWKDEELVGEGDWGRSFVTDLNVYDENGEQILSIDFTDISNEIYGNMIYSQMIDTMGLHVVDVNFDGYMDVIILRSFGGAHSGSDYDCWLWNPVDSIFFRSKSFSEIYNPAIDSVRECIYSNGSNGASNHGWHIYRFIGGEFVITNSLEYTSEYNSTRDSTSYRFVEEQLVNGEMVTVRDDTIQADDYADAMDKVGYADDILWQLCSPRWYPYGGHHVDIWLDGYTGPMHIRD